MHQPLRQTAYKVWISDLINKKVEKEEGEWSPNYILVDNKRVSRVNIIATVVMKYKSEEGNYATLTLDDGSSDIQVKAWNEDTSFLEDLEIGDLVLFIGKIREYNSQVYLVPEIIKQLDKQEWIEIRKKELEEQYGTRVTQEVQYKEPKKEELQVVEEETVASSPTTDRQKIMRSIENLDTEEGADMVEVIVNSKLDEERANSVIQELLKEGEIFEIRSGKLKIIE